MSSTTTITHNSTVSILTDYELHHSGTEESASSNSNSNNNDQTQTAHTTSQPSNWPSNYRRVPAHRPINYNLSQNERPAGSNVGEFIFIQSMLHGVWLNASVSRLWRFTGGRINDRIFRYDVGGEF